MKKNQKELDNFRHRKLTVKVRKLQTTEVQKQFKVGSSYKKNIFSEFNHIYIIYIY